MRELRFFGALALVLAIMTSCEDDQIDNINDQEYDRYEAELFTNVQVDSVEYDVSHNLWMDIYTPVGDTETDRRLVMLAHGGAFVAGTRKNPLMIDMATRLAKHGYVVVSYSYRLASSINTMLDSVASLDVVVRSMVDGTNALGYMTNSVSNGNPYGIDPNTVILGGNSAGAVLSLHVGYVDENDIISSNLQQSIAAEGGWAAHLNPTSPNQIKAIVSLAGGIHKTQWLNAYGPELIMAHGTWDLIVPYNCANVLNNAPTAVQLCGTGAMKPQADLINLSNEALVYPEALHVPWNDDPAVWEQVFSFVVEEMDDAVD